MRQIAVYDTTLRDGEQAPGFSMSLETKIHLAQKISDMGVNVIEAGFPASSDHMFCAVEQISKLGLNSRISALARARTEDILIAARAVKEAQRNRIHIIIPSSDLLIERQFEKKRDEILLLADNAVRCAADWCDNVQLSMMDATRADMNFLLQLSGVGINAGASVVNAADSAGTATPEQLGIIMTEMKRNIPDDVQLSVHCHNDLGLALANTLSAAANGADQIECTLGGIGERSGNAALEECVMVLLLHAGQYKVKTDVDSRKLYPAIHWLFECLQKDIPYNKAIVGKNAFRHEAGIHQHGLQKDRSTYEAFDPKLAGRGESEFAVGPHSGISGLKSKIKALVKDACFEDRIYELLLEKIKTTVVDGAELSDDELVKMIKQQFVEC